MFALQWRDVGADEITVRRSRKLDGSLGEPKNGQTRTVPLLPPARMLDHVPRREDSPFVFHSPRGQPPIKGNHVWSWQQVKAAARVDCRRHDLRHSARISSWNSVSIISPSPSSWGTRMAEDW